jgi:hypothetical protein
MAWKPVKQKEALSPGVRNVISRATLVIVGGLLIWGGVTCLNAARDLRAEWVQRNGQPTPTRRDSSGASYVYLVAFGLLFAGAVCVAGSLLPISAMERFVGQRRDH